MKKILLFSLTLIVCFMITLSANAERTVATVSSEDTYCCDDSAILLPFSISDNQGVMGFRITITYDSELIEIEKVTAGSVTSKGSFIHNLGVEKGQVDVIWYSAEEIKENGTLFTLTVKPILFKNGESTKIEISFSQEDTFNERYEDVSFDCKSVNIFFSEDHTVEESKNTDTVASQLYEVTDTQVIAAVDAALDKSGKSNITELDATDLNNINGNLEIITGSKLSGFNSIEELKTAYIESLKNEYENQVKTNIDSDMIVETINSALNNKNAVSFSDLNDEDRKALVSSLFEDFKRLDSSLPNLFGKIPEDEAVELFEKLKGNTEQEIKNNEPDKPHYPIIVLVCVVLAVGISTVIIFLIRKRRVKAR